MRAAVAQALVAVALLLVGCDASHRSGATDTTASQQPEVRYLALVSARTGKPRRDAPDLSLNAAVPDGRDGWFVGGGLGLAHMRADGRIDRTWGTHESRAIIVCHLVRSGRRLYVEGSGGIQAFDARRGRLLWTGPRVPPLGLQGCSTSVLAFTASSTQVYLAGKFVAIGGRRRRSLAALDARSGRLLAWRLPPLGEQAPTYLSALALAGSRLYVGGVFVSVGGRPRSGLAALDARTGALLPGTRANAGDVATILVTHGELITAGHDGFDVTDVRTGRRLRWPSRIAGSPSAFAVDGPILYLGGGLRAAMQSVDGRPRNNLAAFDLATGRFTSWAPNLARYVMVGTIVPSGDQVLVLAGLTNSVG